MEKVDYRCVTCVYLSHLYIFTSRICVGWFLVSLKITGGIKIRSFQWTNPSSSPNFGLKSSFYQFTGFWFIFLNSVHVFIIHWFCICEFYSWFNDDVFFVYMFSLFLIVFFYERFKWFKWFKCILFDCITIYIIECEVWIICISCVCFSLCKYTVTSIDRTVFVRESDIFINFNQYRLTS